ncbi:hypothetical protein J6E39_05810 [bacterium]|nr:hypothetical protein [bacterium]
MPELDEYTNSWLAEWSQKQDYLDGCTIITKYEKFMLCFYLLNFIDFIELDKWKFETFYSQIIQVLNLENTKYPKYSKTRNYKKELSFKESLRAILMNKLKSLKYKQSEIEKRLKIMSNLYSLDFIEYGFLKYYVLKTVTPLIGKIGEFFDASFNEFEIFGTQCLRLKSWVIP